MSEISILYKPEKQNHSKVKESISEWVNKILLGICAFFLISIFNDIKDIKISQTNMLLDLSSLKFRLDSNEKRIGNLEIWKEDVTKEEINYYRKTQKSNKNEIIP